MVLCVWLRSGLNAGMGWSVHLFEDNPSTNVWFNQVEISSRVLHYKSIRVVLVVVATKRAVIKEPELDSPANFFRDT
jgi:hypothetical protein